MTEPPGFFDRALSFVFTGEDPVARSQRLSDREAALNQRLLERGQISSDQFAQREQVRAANDALAAQLDSEVSDDFYEGLGEGADYLRRGGDSLIGGLLGTALRAVPVWVWIALAVAAAVYFWPVLSRFIKRRSA